MNNLLKQQLIIAGFTFTLVGILIIGFFIYFKTLPEYSKVKDLIQHNSNVIATFGAIKNIEMDNSGLDTQWTADWSNGFSSGSYKGTFHFSITGSIRSGVISVDWKSSENHDTHINSIDEIKANGDLSNIWKP